MLESEAWFCGSPLIPFWVDVPLSDGCESVLSECSERRALHTFIVSLQYFGLHQKSNSQKE